MMRFEVFLQSTAIKILREKLSQVSFSAGESIVFFFLFFIIIILILFLFFFLTHTLFYPSIFLLYRPFYRPSHFWCFTSTTLTVSFRSQFSRFTQAIFVVQFNAMKLQLQNRACKPAAIQFDLNAIYRRGLRCNSRNTVTLGSSFTF